MEDNFNNNQTTAPQGMEQSNFPNPAQSFAQPETPAFTAPAQEVNVLPTAQPDTVQNSNNYQQYNTDGFASYNPVTPANAVKSKKPLYITLAIVLFAAIAVGAFFLINTLFGVSYEKSERKFFGNAFSSVQDTTEKVKSSSEATKTVMTVDVADQFLSELFGEEMKLNPTVIELLAKTDNGEFAGVLSLFNGSKSMATMNMWVNEEAKDVLIAIPELFNEYIKISAKSETSGSTGISDENIKLFEKILNESADAYFKVVNSVTVISKKSLDEGVIDVKIEYDNAKIEFTDTVLVDLAEAILQVVDNNPEIYDVFNQFTSEDVKFALSSIRNAKEACNGETVFTMNAFLKNDTVIGRNFYFAGQKVLEYISYSDNNEYTFSLNAKFGEYAADIKLSSRKIDDAYTGMGKALVAIGDEKLEYTLEFEHIQHSKEKIGGKFTIAIPIFSFANDGSINSDGVVNVDGLFATEGEKKVSWLNVYLGGAKVVSVTTTNELSEMSSIPAKPDESTVTVIDMNSRDAEQRFEEIMSGIDFGTFVAGLADENGNYDIISLFASALGMLSSPGIDDSNLFDGTDVFSEPAETESDEASYPAEYDLGSADYYAFLADYYDGYRNADGSIDLEKLFTDSGIDYETVKEYEDDYQKYYDALCDGYRAIANGTMTENELTEIISQISIG